jgi:hypothetical protein
MKVKALKNDWTKKQASGKIILRDYRKFPVRYWRIDLGKY